MNKVTTLDRSGFTFYKSYSDIYFKLNNEQKVLFIDAILTHQLTTIEVDDFTFDDTLLDIAWTGIKPNLHSNKVKYTNGSKPKAKANNKQDTSEKKAKPKPSANNDNDNVNDNVNEKNKLFEKFWINYPKKTDKKRACVSFNKLSKSKQETATRDCVVRYSDTEVRYVPNPTTYLNGERWEDERAVQQSTQRKVLSR